MLFMKKVNFIDKGNFLIKAFFSVIKQLNFIYLHQVDILYSLILIFHPNIKKYVKL